MNEITINDGSGSLDAKGRSHRFFDSLKKAKFLQLANRYWKERHEMPRPEDLCDVIGIGIATFYRHLLSDDQFKAGWYEIQLFAKGELESIMYNNGKRPGGYMDRITWLRRHFPQEYNPEYRVTVAPDPTALKHLAENAKKVLEEQGVVDTTIAE